MQVHKKITIINTFLLFIFFALSVYFFNIEISLNNLLKFLFDKIAEGVKFRLNKKARNLTPKS